MMWGLAKLKDNTMQEFNGYQYTQIAVANAMGLDKKLWEERIQWVEDNMDNLEDLMDEAGEDKFAYRKAVYALRDAQEGRESGFMFELDGTASCQQIYAALMGCKKTARQVNLIHEGKRADLYLAMSIAMGMGITRGEIKYPLMCHYYNSTNKPKELFGDGTPEYVRFMNTLVTELPGAEMGKNIINNCWNPEADVHAWEQLDDMVCHVRVSSKEKAVIDVQEIEGSFTYAYELYGPTETGVSLPANLIQSFDALIVREMKRRCNYNLTKVELAIERIEREMDNRCNLVEVVAPKEPAMICMNQLHQMDERDMSDYDLQRMVNRLHKILAHKPFPLITRHDAFVAHPNNMNVVRYNYKEILAEIAESPALATVLSSLTGRAGSIEKLSYDLAPLIRESEYALS